LSNYDEKTVENNMVFVGLQGMIDPARVEAIKAVESCKHAGIRSIMITGDHKLTAVAVARELGISGGALTGEELDKMSDEEFQKSVDDVSVYARVSPHHKMRIIKALQGKGEIAVMTGDGINDAPAIKSADVGVAMGITGTEVTKEASDMVLADDNFASIVAAIREGRGSFDNIIKYLMYLLSCNIAEILIMFLAGLLWFGEWAIPLLTAQILWVNLLTDGLPAMALGVDPPTKDVMNRPPRDPQQSIFAEMKGYLLYLTIVLTLGVLFVYGWAYNGGLSIDKARSMALATLISFELFVCFECRSLKYSIFKIGITSNKWLIAAVVPQFILLFVVISSPIFNPLMRTAPLTALEYAVSIGVAFTVIPAIELFKFVSARLGKEYSF
ncbi:MAG: HAD-IC family P-type ATPase, partial [Candidatus Bathyarchaeota archaeon]